MPSKFEYDARRGVLHAKVTGDVDPNEVRREFQKVLDDPEIPSDTDTVWDLRRMNFSSVDTSIVRAIAADRSEIEALRGSARTAFVVSALDEEIIVRLYHAHTQHLTRETRIFRVIEKALAWLEGTDREDLTA